MIHQASETPDNFELLEKLAKYSFDLAATECLPENACGDYHTVWSLARLANELGTSLAGWPFFHKQLACIVESNSNPRVLISGTADTAIAAHVVGSFKTLESRAQLIVVDRCATPIMQNQLFAQQQGFELECHVEDMLSFQCDAVDVIVCHSFLNFFSPDQRTRLFDNWAQLLNKGGSVLISNRIEKEPDSHPATPTSERLAEKIHALERTAIKMDFGDEEKKRLLAAAERIWSQAIFKTASLTEKELRSLCNKSGLDMQEVSYQPRNSKEGKGPLAIVYGDSGHRAEIVLTKS